MRPALVIAGKDLRQRFRDRSAIVLGFVAPLVVTALMSVALGGTEDLRVTIGLADHDGGELAAALATALASPELAELVTVETLADPSDADRAVRSGTVDAALVVPPGFSEAMAGTEPATLAVLGSVDSSISALVAEAVASSFAAQVNAGRLSVVTALAAGAPADRLPELAGLASAARIPIQVTDEPLGIRQLRAIEYYAPGMAIFFALFAVGFGARSFVLERREGTLDRMAAAPVAGHALLAGKALAVAVFVGTSLITVVGVSALVFGARWGSPVAVGVLCLVMTAAVTALTALVSALARTERQAEGMSSFLVFGLALAGGNFVFVSVAPELLRRLALLTPNGWALRGFTDLATGEDPVAATLPAVVAISAFTAAAAALAVLLSRRAVAQ